MNVNAEKVINGLLAQIAQLSQELAMARVQLALYAEEEKTEEEVEDGSDTVQDS